MKPQKSNIETKKIEVTSVFARLMETVKNVKTDSTIIEYGGAGSSKSYSIAQFILHILMTDTGARIAIGRKFFASHKTTAMFLIIKLLNLYGLYQYCKHNKTDNTIEYHGNYILFFSTGEGERGREKIKSADFNIIWLEEATEFDWEEYMQFTLRLRSPKLKSCFNIMLLSLNPVDENHWIKTKLVDVSVNNVIVHHSTYKDNLDFLSKEYVARLKRLIDEDYNYYRIYCLGEWGRLENVIYKKWEIVDRLPDRWQAWQYGLDWGYVNETAIVKVVLGDDATYLHEVLYEPGLTNSDIIERLSHFEKGDIQADPSRKDAIEEIKRAGYAIFEANNDVKTGLDVCKRRLLRITRESVNLISEIQNYSYRKDRHGIVHEDPVKYRDHLCDAFRYALMGMTERFGYATSSAGRQVARSRSFLPAGMY